MAETGIRRRPTRQAWFSGLLGRLQRLRGGPLAALSNEQRKQLIAVQVEASRPAYSGVLLGGAFLVLVLGIFEAAGHVPHIGYPPSVMIGSGLLMAVFALASLRLDQLWLRLVTMTLYGVGLGTLVSMPLGDYANQLAFRTGLFNLVPIAALALTVRSFSATVLVTFFISFGALRIIAYGTPFSGATLYWLFTLTSIGFGLMLRSYRMAYAVSAFNASHALWRQASTDELTGLLNRTGWNSAVPKLRAGAGASGQQLSAVFFDIDRFKRVNDTHGHAVGDEILCRLADAIVHHQPGDSVAARFGGEEFVVLLATADAEEAVAFAESVRHTFAAAVVRYKCRVSAGIAHQRPGDQLSELLHRADRGLYAAKAEGRDRVSVLD